MDDPKRHGSGRHVVTSESLTAIANGVTIVKKR